MTSNGHFPICYFAPISYYYYLLQHPTCYLEMHEHFIKQTYRNRCQILSPNGIQNLSIPIENVKRKKPYSATKIAYVENWQMMHWRSLEAAYRSSPYFEFYEDHIAPFFLEKKYEYLHELNLAINELIIKLINIPVNVELTTSFEKNPEKSTDYRGIMSSNKIPKNLEFKPYIQVFSDRHPFMPNLSILDLLFNQGPNSISYLKGIKKV